ncbi:MAG TPA: TonB-dependent receptor [Acidobacteriaceae bacterium]
MNSIFKYAIRLSLLFLSSLLVSHPVFAQFAQRGSISGTVLDPSGDVVPGADVNLTDLEQNGTRKAKSDKTGHFEFDNLAAGQYQLTAAASGFSTSASQPITVNIGELTQYDFHLTAGSVKETVTVTGESAGLETQQTGNTTNISARQLQDLPLNGLNFTSIAALAPGVSTFPQANINPGGTYSVGAQFAMGGIAFTSGGSFEGSRDNGFYVNGVNIDDNYESSISFEPSSQALGTGNIQVSDFSPAVGGNMSSMNMETKAGTTQFHGEGYEFMENTDLNATNPYDKLVQGITGTPAVKPSIIRNQFGGNLGGPVWIPRLLPGMRKRVFFFANYEKMIEHDGNQLVALAVPSAAERTGDFSELLVNNPNPVQLYNPFQTTYDSNGDSSRPPIPNNRLDLATKPGGSAIIDPGSAAILKALWPLPNVPNAPSNAVNFIGYQTPGIDNYTLDTRFDAKITSSDLVFVTWSKTNGTQSLTGGLSPQNLYDIPVGNQAYLITANYVHVFGPNLTNEFIFGTGDGALLTMSQGLMSWYNSSSNPLNQLFKNTGTGITQGVIGLFAGDYSYAVPGAPEVFRAENESWQYSDNLDWVHGKHTLAFGFNYFRKSEDDWDFTRQIFFGGGFNYGFGSSTLPAFSASGSSLGYEGGDGIADLVMGLPSNMWVRYNVAGGNPTAPDYLTIFPSWGFYANDRFRISPKFTVSAGLRYDLSMPWFTPDPNAAPCCAIYTPNSSGGVLEYPGIATGLPEHYLSAPKLSLAPRISLTYSYRPETVIRAGYGIFYDTGSSQISSNVGNASYGTSSTVNYNYNNITLGKPQDTPYLSLADIFPAPQTTTLGSFPVTTGIGQGYDGDDQWSTIVYYDQKSMPLPYYEKYTLDVQQQVTPHDVFEISYNGIQGRKGWNEVNLNLPSYRTGWVAGNGAVTNYDAARPNNSGRWGDIYVMRPQLNSSYNALIGQWRHTFSRGMQFDANYTWGKTMSDYPWSNTLANNGSTGYGGSGFQYPNLYDRGEASFSHPQRFVFSGIWSPQYGQAWQHAVRAVAAGWRISGIFTLESGNADTVVNGGPGAACSAGTSTAQCPAGYGSSAFDNAGFDELSLTGDSNIGHGEKSPFRQFNTAAFSIPANDVRGNSGLGTVRGPGQDNLDLSLAKTFPVYENMHIEFRGDAFNALNHTQWNGIVTNFPSGDSEFPFGMVTGAREARIGQVSAKLVF